MSLIAVALDDDLRAEYVLGNLTPGQTLQIQQIRELKALREQIGDWNMEWWRAQPGNSG